MNSVLLPLIAVATALAVGAPLAAYSVRDDAPEGRSPAPLARATQPGATSSDGASAASESEQTRAQEILEQLAETYPSLEGASVRIGQTPKGEEAVAYYTAGEIVIDAEHSVEIEKILAHEIWHVIDWRDNGRLDWGEDLPPANASDYR